MRKHGYIFINVGRVVLAAHRLAWVYMTGSEPATGIDHKDRNPSNNRWDNLREASQPDNMGNKVGGRRSKTGVKGVHPFKGGPKFQARVMRNGKNVFTKVFDTIEEAKAAYDAAAKVAHGPFFCP